MDVSLTVFEILMHKPSIRLVFATTLLFDAPLKGPVRISGWNLSGKN